MTTRILSLLTVFVLFTMQTYATRITVNGVTYDDYNSSDIHEGRYRNVTVVGISSDYEGELVIPALPAQFGNGVFYYRVTEIARNVFNGNTKITSVTLPNTVTVIKEGAFEHCTNMTAATILGGAIEGDAFYGCSGLLSVTFGEKVTSIGNSIAFYGCTALTRFEVSPENAAYSSLDGVLYNKDRTELLLYPLGKTDNSFAIPGTVTTLAEAALMGSSLRSITLPESLKTIGEHAFDNCPNLNTLAIPRNVTNIGTSAFNNCTGLTAFEVAPENTVYSSADDGILYNRNRTTIVRYPPNKASVSFTLPASVAEISRYAFSDCQHLSSLSTPGVTTVGIGAFGWSSIKSITLARSVNFINIYAFSSCKELTDLTVFWNSPSEVTIPVTDSQYDDIFYGTDKSAVNLHVPPGTKAAYMADNIWKGFNIRDDATGVDDVAPSVVAVHFNPATGLVAINGLRGNEMIHLYNINGQLLFTHKAASEAQNISVGHLPAGVYIVRVNGQSIKIIKR